MNVFLSYVALILKKYNENLMKLNVQQMTFESVEQ